MHNKIDSNPAQTNFDGELEQSSSERQVPSFVIESSEPVSEHPVQLRMQIYASQTFNDQIAGGVRLTRLNELSFNILENIFCGMHNINVSHNILRKLNPAELVAVYLATGKDKHDTYDRWNSEIASNIERYDDVEKRKRLFALMLSDEGYPRDTTDFLGLVKKMNERAYSIGSFRFVAGKMPPVLGRHESERLEDVPEFEKRMFLSSFYAIYIPSSRQESRHPHAFHDPNLDGNNKGIYADRIYHSIKRDYAKNEQQADAAPVCTDAPVAEIDFYSRR